VVKRLSQWFAERPIEPTTPVFPTAKGTAMSSDALQRLVAQHIKAASKTCPSLQTKRVTPHTLRHYADHRTMPTGTKAKSLAELSDEVFVNLKLPSRSA
jgi:integrase